MLNNCLYVFLKLVYIKALSLFVYVRMCKFMRFLVSVRLMAVIKFFLFPTFAPNAILFKEGNIILLFILSFIWLLYKLNFYKNVLESFAFWECISVVIFYCTVKNIIAIKEQWDGTNE